MPRYSRRSRSFRNLSISRLWRRVGRACVTASPLPARRKILVIKLSALGDFVQALGPAAAIRRHHAGDEITLLTTDAFAELARQSGLFDRIAIDGRPTLLDAPGWLALRRALRSGHFDRVYDLQTSDRSSFYAWLFLPARPPEWSGIAWHCSHPARQSRPPSAAHDRQAGGTAADGRDLSDTFACLPGIPPALAGWPCSARLFSADPRIVSAPSGEALAGASGTASWPSACSRQPRLFLSSSVPGAKSRSRPRSTKLAARWSTSSAVPASPAWPILPMRLFSPSATIPAPRISRQPAVIRSLSCFPTLPTRAGARRAVEKFMCLPARGSMIFRSIAYSHRWCRQPTI